MSENSIQWLVENHVILSKIYNWDAESLAGHIIEVNNLVNQSNLPLVHTLWDFTEIKSYPTNLNQINNGVQTLLTNDRLGWVITIIDHQIVAFLSQVATSRYKVRYQTVKSLDEAMQFLQTRDTTLSL